MNILFVVICFFNLAFANVYNCTSPEGEIVKIDKTKFAPRYEWTSATWFRDTILNNEIANKTPVLIYYVIDSNEPYMKLSTNYEIERLKNSCKGKGVNFVIIQNSSYINNNSFTICKNQLVQTISFKNYTKLNESLKRKRSFLKKGTHITNDLGPMRYLVKYNDHTRKSFYNFPLTHPDFLYDLINFTTQEKSLFPSDQYLPLLNLKSHGNEDMVLSGLHSCQTEAKTKSQNEIISKTFSNYQAKSLKSFLNTNTNANIDSINELLGRIWLGSNDKRGPITYILDSKGYPQPYASENEKLISFLEANNRSSSERLIIFNNQAETNASLSNHIGLSNLIGLGNLPGLGESVYTLGANEGLGGSFSFGTEHLALNTVLGDLFSSHTNKVLGFLMLEACNTKRDITFNHSNQENILGVYSAKGSLWYRNLNWWEILQSSKGSSYELLKLIHINTMLIPNIQINL